LITIFSGCPDSGISLPYRHAKSSREFYKWKKLGKISQLVYCLLICPGPLSQANLYHEEKKGGEKVHLESERSEGTFFTAHQNFYYSIKQRKEKKMNNTISRFLKEDDGVTMIEYGLIAAIIAIGVLLTLQGVRDGLITLFGKVKAALTS
jgi:pilus assembly protein Flp/PilA